MQKNYNDQLISSRYSLFMNLGTWFMIYDHTLKIFFKSWLTESLSTCKISGWLTSYFLRYGFFLIILKSDWPRAFLTQTKSTFTSFNLYQHAKNNTYWPNCSWDIVDLWILKDDWQKHFHPPKTKSLHTIFYVSWIFICLPKMKLIHLFFFLKYNWFYNLIGWEHFLP